MIDLAFWAPVMAGGLVAGSSSGVLGVYIVGMRIPFLGVCIAHAALAGAIFGALCGLAGSWLLLPALAAAVLTALLLGLADPRRFHMDANLTMALLFSVSMGLAFLGLGLFSVLGRSDGEVRGLLWGNLTACRWADVWLMLGAAGGMGLFLAACQKELRAILFSREDAAAAGIHATAVWALWLVLAAAVMTVNFQAVGGLMIYSLVTNPATAAFQLARGSRAALLLAAGLGAFSGLGGFLLSAWTDLPSGAVTVLLSSALVALAAVVAHRRR